MAVTVQMIATALGVTVPSPSSAKAEQWQMWINDALMLIEARKAEMGVTSVLDPARLDYVVREAVVAHVRLPDDLTQISVTADDTNVAKTYRSGKGRVSIHDDLWALLGLASRSGAAFSILPSRSTGAHVPWCNLAFGAQFCSCGADLTNYEYPLYEGGLLAGTDGYAPDAFPEGL